MDPFNKQEFLPIGLKHWFEENKRNFPWRQTPSPYAVWVSEVMLQQTQASVVIPYFEKWMARFPTIQTLAAAPIEEVIKLWEGLGYYSRARNLHAGAKFLVDHHQGELPSDPKLLEKVKGLGPYTIGAILSFAFHKKGVALDGNVARVISRLFCIEDPIDTPSVQKKLRAKVEDLLPDTEPWVMMEALIELGATVCTRRPTCAACPLQEECRAFHLGKAEQLPNKKQRYSTTLLEREVLLINHEQEFLVQHHQGKKVMSGLYEFPYFEKGQSHSFYPGKLGHLKNLKNVTHTFTRYRSQLFPSLWIAHERREIEGFQWIALEELNKLPFSSGHRQILKNLLEDHAHLTY
ncbi:MAG: A/G-specific adenine glycosylase [Verrucomicrobia bacterium]|nr:A/G-specific adenine glycosylase [Verrucomicrobiota bacterium]